MDRARRLDVLRDMGVTAWELRRPPAAEEPVPQAPAAPHAEPSAPAPVTAPSVGVTVSVPPPPTGDAWAPLRGEVAACTRCALRAGCTQTVFGVGAEDADWMFIGEAPGAEEDRRGEPFVGRAGQLLDSMLGALGLDRRRVFIANILKCRPPDNRDPQPDEVAQCLPYLQRQVALVRPKLIVCVGRIAAHNLLGVDTPLGRLRGSVHWFGEVPVVVTYHPAYLLRAPGEKRKAWSDLKLARRVLTEGA